MREEYDEPSALENTSVKKKKNKKKQQKKRTIKKVIIIVVVLAVLVCAGFFGYRYYQNYKYQESLKQHEETFDSLRQEKNTDNDGKAVIEGTSPTHDFNSYWKQNKDIYAFVTVDGTGVDYPILQNEEDNYYLMRNLDGSEGYPGCIYTNRINSMQFDDYLTVIYGHNMKNKTMFGSLHNFDDEDFCKTHTEFTIETPEELLTYRIFAVVNFTDDNITYYLDPKDPSSVSTFVNSIKTESAGRQPDYIDDSVEISDSDHLVVLATCIGKEPDRRFLVVGKLTGQTIYSNPIQRYFNDDGEQVFDGSGTPAEIPIMNLLGSGAEE